MWLLILTIVGSGGNVRPSIEHLPGFVTQQACEIAAAKWVEQVSKQEHKHLSISAFTVCVHSYPPGHPTVLKAK